MKLFSYFTLKYPIENYFYGCYISNKNNEIPSFFVNKGGKFNYDILNKKDANYTNFCNVRRLTDYYKFSNEYVSLYTAKKLAKKYADKYTNEIIDELNGYVDKFGLKTKREDPIDKSKAITLKEDDYKELN